MTDEIVNKEFTRAFKGYDVDEVEEYIETVIGLYEQLENENKELSLRCEQLTASLEESERKAAEAEQKTQTVASESDEIVAEAREKAKEIVASAENSARRLLTEVKLKRDELNRAIEEKHTAASAEIESTRERAVEEAKELILTTKQNCQDRTREVDAEIEKKRRECDVEIKQKVAECEAQIERIKAEHESEIAELEAKKAAAEAEYNETARMAAEFREKLFAHYSEQIMMLEGFEIPSVPESETVVEEEITPIVEDEFVPEFEPMQEPSFELVPEIIEEPITEEAQESVSESLVNDATPEMTMVFDTHSASEMNVAKKQKSAFDDTMTIFNVEKEHSGQVHYNSSEISSVKHKLSDIMTKKGMTESADDKAVSKKLGFLK